MAQGKRIRITPKLKAEPDLDQIVLALLSTLDERSELANEPPTRQAS